ncbi:hypothetical protein HNR21_005831 [Actinomadura cellulosilytica]|uniref:Uncharacterized protein n=1 Tax=Thermomonospora cellulosilytica TaxID=1411118 RepID=A0A7W3N3Q1_9ACTN|nr:hypothetical protein [Thermomonospora cellulosilytica]
MKGGGVPSRTGLPASGPSPKTPPLTFLALVRSPSADSARLPVPS